MLELYRGIKGLQKSSFIDFPRTASAVLFFAGCNLRCPYCHNPLLIYTDNHDAYYSPEEIDLFLRKRRHLLDGVVISGGEPSLHPQLPQLIEYLHQELGYQVKLDTNGLNAQLLTHCKPDYLALDLKTIPAKYATLLGSKLSEEEVRETWLRSKVLLDKIPGEIRITAAPGIIERKDFGELAELCQDTQVFVQPFRDKMAILDPTFFEGKTHDAQFLQDLQDALATKARSVSIRGQA